MTPSDLSTGQPEPTPPPKTLLRQLWESIRMRVREVFGLQDGTDMAGTVSTISKGVVLRGANIWILMASALLACIGLDQNSAAVIIGAMLISPLMSPILGIGLGTAIYDRQLLTKALRNFGIATGVSIGTAMFYWLITPFGEPTEQMNARITPTLLDVGVAVFGGVAGIVASSRLEKTNAIPGVAIATALMPPLCVAGYGIATLNIEYFAGAFYLFFLNAFFIALVTYAVIRYLGFPLKSFLDPKMRRQAQRYVTAFIIVVLVPAVFLLVGVLQKIRFERSIGQFVQEQVNTPPPERVTFQPVPKDTTRQMRLYITGQPVPPDSVVLLERRLRAEYDVDNVRLKFIQMDVTESERQKMEADITTSVLRTVGTATEDFQTKEQEIARLQRMIKRTQADTMRFGSLSQELDILFPELEGVAFAELLETRFTEQAAARIDTLPTLFVRWNKEVRAGERDELAERLQAFLRKRTELGTIRVLDWREEEE